MPRRKRWCGSTSRCSSASPERRHDSPWPASPSRPATPASSVAVRRLALVEAGSPEGFEPLRHAAAERELLARKAKRLGLELSRPPATFPDVAELLRGGGFDLLHLAGHGRLLPRSPDLASFLLEDGRSLRPADLEGELAGRWQGDRPLVFLNACQMGRPEWSRTRLGGWPPRWIACGCGAFVGPQWTVRDELALGFVRVFYDEMAEGTTLGRAVRRARRESGLMAVGYAAFGDPNAVLSFQPI